jgi:hypothetical protein
MMASPSRLDIDRLGTFFITLRLFSRLKNKQIKIINHTVYQFYFQQLYLPIDTYSRCLCNSIVTKCQIPKWYVCIQFNYHKITFLIYNAKISDNNAESGKVPRMLAAFPR